MTHTDTTEPAATAERRDSRDLTAATLVGTAGTLLLLQWLVTTLLLDGGSVVATRTTMLAASAPAVSADLAFHVWAVVALVRRDARVGRVLAAGLGLLGAQQLMANGLAILREGGVTATVPLFLSLATSAAAVAAAAVVITVWQDRGMPGLGRPLGTGGRVVAAGAALAVVARPFPAVASSTGGSLRPVQLDPTGWAVTVLVLATMLVVLAVATRLEDGRSGRALALLLGVGGIATGVGNLLVVRLLDVAVGPTPWAWLGLAGYGAVCVGAVLLGRQTSSATA